MSSSPVLSGIRLLSSSPVLSWIRLLSSSPVLSWIRLLSSSPVFSWIRLLSSSPVLSWIRLLSSSPVFSGIHVAQSFVFSVMFCRSLFVLLSFFFGHCVVRPSIFDYPSWYLNNLFLTLSRCMLQMMK